MARRETVAEAYQRGLREGQALGAQQVRDHYAKSHDIRGEQLKLMNAVGQTVQAVAQVVTGLAQTFDNGPRS